MWYRDTSGGFWMRFLDGVGIKVGRFLVLFALLNGCFAIIRENYIKKLIRQEKKMKLVEDRTLKLQK
jgi:hypothetical protein